jgi:hypothetical protein
VRCLFCRSAISLDEDHVSTRDGRAMHLACGLRASLKHMRAGRISMLMRRRMSNDNASARGAR